MSYSFHVFYDVHSYSSAWDVNLTFTGLIQQVYLQKRNVEIRPTVPCRKAIHISSKTFKKENATDFIYEVAMHDIVCVISCSYILWYSLGIYYAFPHPQLPIAYCTILFKSLYY